MALVNADFGNGPQQVWQNDDGSYWNNEGTAQGSPESIRPDMREAYTKNQLAKTSDFYNKSGYQQFTPEQVQAFQSSGTKPNADSPNLNPAWGPNLGMYNDSMYGGNNMWYGPQAGPQHTDQNGPGSLKDMLVPGSWAGGEVGQSNLNDMKYGAVVGSMPFLGLAGTALMGAGSVAGGAAIGGTETGITAGAAGSGFGATGAATTGAEAGGTIAGGEGSTSLIGNAGTDTATTAGGSNSGSIMNNPYLNDPLAGADTSGTFGPSMMPEGSTGGLISGAGSGASPLSGAGAGVVNGGAASTGGLLDWLGQAGSNLSDSFQPSDLAKTGGNLLIQQLLRNRQQQQATQVQTAGNPLNDAARQPFINQATNMVNNPSDYLQNNPFATAMRDFYKNSVIPNQVAKSGNPSEVIDRSGSQFNTALGGNYNQLLQTLQGFGGFNQGNSGVGPSVPLLQNSNTSQNEAFRALGGMGQKAITGIFGDVTKPSQGGTGTGGTTLSA